MTRSIPKLIALAITAMMVSAPAQIVTAQAKAENAAALLKRPMAKAYGLAAEDSGAGRISYVTISPQPGSTDDTARIQQAIDTATGQVFFKAGTYNLKRPLRLRSFLSYVGEGSLNEQSGSILNQQTPGQAIFTFQGTLDSVTITGLTFKGPCAYGIAASGLLANSTIQGNSFSRQLAECIAASLQSTRIERNQFGMSGAAVCVPASTQKPHHRHIRSVPTVQDPATVVTNANWIAYNQFFSAADTESILFQQGAQLHIVGNQFELNDALTTLRINGMFQVIVEGNYFERNAGQAQMEFSNAPGDQLANWIVRLENNFYNMDGSRERGGAPNKYIFLASGATKIYMGYEAGTLFAPDAELTHPELFNACYLKVTGPFRFNGYLGTQASGNPQCP